MALLLAYNQPVERDTAMTAQRFVVVGLAVILFGCTTTGSSKAKYGVELGEVIDTVNTAGFGIAEAFVDVSSCSTDDECIDAGDSLVREYTAYIPILEEHIRTLEGMEVPEDYQGFHTAYVEQLKLRVEAGEMIIEGWESFDDALLDRGFQKFRESQAKMGDIVDELEPLLE